MREDLGYLQQEVKETQEKPIEHTSWVKELAYGIKAPREETPRERTLRLYPHLMPTRAQVEREKRRIGLGSPGVEEKLTEIWSWAKGNWHWIGIGGTLYTILLIACAKRGK